MYQYLNQKLEEEYHHLNLWYFVFFFYGIACYFKFVDFFLDYKYLHIILPITFAVSLVLSLILFILPKSEYLISYFFAAILLSFTLGTGTASLKFITTDSKPLSKVEIFNINAEISEIKPTINGIQIILKNIVSLNNQRKLGTIKVSLSEKKSPDLALDLAVGDVINIKVKLFPISSSLVPGGYDFGIYMYLNSIDASGYAIGAPKILSKKSDNGYWNKIYSDILNIRNSVYRKLIDVLDQYEGNFIAAILIGQTKAIDSKMAENMRNSGISHILSVSGLHLSLVAMIFFIVSRFLLNCSNYLSYKINIKITAGIISILGSVGYLFLSGANIAATRAFIMTLIVILAIIFGRSPYPLRSVMIAAMCILILWPQYVLHPSFQLSFSAVLCLISGYEIYVKNQKIFGHSKGLFGLIKLYIFTNIYSSFLASIVTAPFVIYHFYKFATYSILMNLLAVPLMSFFMMPLSIISVILMPFGFSDYCLKMVGFFVKIVTDSASYVSTLPGAVINTGYITDSSMLIFTFGFFWICVWQTAWRYLGLIIMLFGVGTMYFTPKPDLIYDHRFGTVTIKDGNSINIYSQNKISDFTKNYLLGWYGANNVKTIPIHSGLQDKIFQFSSGKEQILVSLNYDICSDADVQVILSKKLICDSGKMIINYQDLIKSGIVLIFCKNSQCSAQFGSKALWKD